MKKTAITFLCVSILALAPACAYNRKKDNTGYGKESKKRAYRNIKENTKGRTERY